MKCAIDQIVIPQRKRSADADKVQSLVNSIRELGLLNPITVTGDYHLIAGLHRLEACKALGWQEIPVSIASGLEGIRAELAEIDENLIRSDLTELQRGIQMARRKEIYEELYPGTKQGAKGGWHNSKTEQLETVTVTVSSFATDTAEKTGQSESAIRRQARIGKELAGVAAELEGTPIEDSQKDLLELSRMKDAQRREVVAVIKSGEAESVTEAKRILKERERERERERNRQLVAQAQQREQERAKTQTQPVLSDEPKPEPEPEPEPPHVYKTIVLDPPWDWGDEGDVDQFGRGRPTYDTMPIAEIEALPIPELAEPNAHIYLWITNRSLPKGFRLLEAWGFRYVTMLTWCKPSFGMGNYYRGSTEHILFGVRGSLGLLRRDVGTWFEAKRPGKHSSKPPEFYELVETCSPGPWLEMFARNQRPGWQVWGAEVVEV